VLCGARDRQSLDLVDNAGVGWFVPVERIAERFDQVAALVESPLERGATWTPHWEPRSRGVATFAEKGFFYTGHAQAYNRLRDHLDGGAGLLVITGARARGKSALLARAVVLSSPRYLTLLGERADAALGGYKPRARPVEAAVFARAKSPEQVAREIAVQLGFGALTVAELVAAAQRGELAGAVVVDAVDESLEPRVLVGELIVELAAAGLPVAIAGLRRHFASAVPRDAGWVDLDGDTYRDEGAIPGYVGARLQRSGPYHESSARAVATAVARRAAGNFLVAELVARTLSKDQRPIDTGERGWERRLPSDLSEAFRDYLGRFGDQHARMLSLLHPLAHALGEGLPVEPGDVWLAAANALKPDVLEPFTSSDLRGATARAGDYLISEAESGARRLFHEGLGDAIRTLVAEDAVIASGSEPTEEAIHHQSQRFSQEFLDALLGLLPEPEAPAELYASTDPYLLTHLPNHLAEQGRAGELLDRPGLLLMADQDALRRALVRGALTIPAERDAVRVAAVHALAYPRSGIASRAAAFRAALRRQGEHQLADRVRQALPDTECLPYELLVAGPSRSESRASSPSSAATVRAALVLPAPMKPTKTSAPPSAGGAGLAGSPVSASIALACPRDATQGSEDASS